MKRIGLLYPALLALLAGFVAPPAAAPAQADTLPANAAQPDTNSLPAVAPQALETLLPISERFAEAALDGPTDEAAGAQAATDEVPDFRRHIVPLVGRLGCNGRACHGSFQGQGGFRLSLFGYDFKSDHE